MTQSRNLRAAIALAVIVCVVTVGCAGNMQSSSTGSTSSGQVALMCGAGGALAGAAIGAGVARNWQGALIGAAVGAMAAGLTCFAVSEYKSQQVRSYGETQQATGYQASQGDSVQITSYEIAPAAAAPGSSVAFNATYTVMTPNPDADVTVTEIRTLQVQDPATKSWRELGRVPNQVTVKPGTRQANGKFDVRSGVAQGNYQIAFEVVKDTVRDVRTLPLVVTTQQAVLSSPQARVAQVGDPGAKPIDSASAAPAFATSSAPAAAPAPAAGVSPTPGSTLSSLGEQQPQAPPQSLAAAPAQSAATPPVPAPRITYFVASKVSGQGALRGGPGSNYPVVGSITAGSRYPVVQSVRGANATWIKIRMDTGSEVWVAGALGHVIEE